jgi:PAS domain S-box-containing protein
MDRNGVVMYANRAFAQISGREPGSLPGMRFQQFLSRAGAIFYETHFAPSLLLRGRLEEISFDVLRPGGESVPVFVTASLARDEGEQPGYIVMAAFVAKQRRQYETELLRARREAEQIAEVVRRSSDAIIRLSAEGLVETWNSGAQQIFGFSSAECIEKPLVLLFPEDVRADLEAAIRDVKQGREVNTETIAQHKTGRTVDVSISLTPHMEAPGIVVAFSAVIRDTTRRKQAERALLQNEKLVSVGRLASSIAHEINNPLASVTNLLYILQTRVADEETKALVITAQEELARVSQIATQTLRFHKQSGSRSEVDLESVTDSVLGLYRGRLQNSGIHTINDSCNCLPLLCYENELRQVLVNLVANAFDAMRSGGRLTIRCRNLTHWPAGTKSSRITVADTGTGMDDATLQRLFEPFFSTKGIGGVGLGLWISKELVTKNGGSIRIRSSRRAGRAGTTVVMWFPQVS